MLATDEYKTRWLLIHPDNSVEFVYFNPVETPNEKLRYEELGIKVIRLEGDRYKELENACNR